MASNLFIFYHRDCVDGYLAAGTLMAAHDPEIHSENKVWYKSIQYNDTADIVLNYQGPNPRVTDFVFVDFAPSAEIINALLGHYPKSITVLDHHEDAMTRISQYPQNHPVRYLVDKSKCGTSLATIKMHTILKSLYIEPYDNGTVASNIEVSTLLHRISLADSAYVRIAEIFDTWQKDSSEFELALALNSYWRTEIANADMSPRSFILRLIGKDIPKTMIDNAYMYFKGMKKLYIDILRTAIVLKNDDHDAVIYALYAPYETATMLGYYAEQVYKQHDASKGAILAVIDNSPQANGATKVSLRGFSGMECLSLAQQLGGGGHKSAASAYIKNFSLDLLGKQNG